MTYQKRAKSNAWKLPLLRRYVCCEGLRREKGCKDAAGAGRPKGWFGRKFGCCEVAFGLLLKSLWSTREKWPIVIQKQVTVSEMEKILRMLMFCYLPCQNKHYYSLCASLSCKFIQSIWNSRKNVRKIQHLCAKAGFSFRYFKEEMM